MHSVYVCMYTYKAKDVHMHTVKMHSVFVYAMYVSTAPCDTCMYIYTNIH